MLTPMVECCIGLGPTVGERGRRHRDCGGEARIRHGLPAARYMGGGFVVWLVAQIDEAELNPAPPRVYKYGVFGDGDPHF